MVVLSILIFKNMKLLIKKLLIFLIPFVIVFGTVALVDPYDFFSSSNNKKKKDIAIGVDHGWLSYTVDYKRNHYPNVIIGSSRPHVINVNNIPEKDWGQMSLGGATIPEYLKAFWFIAEDKNLKKIIIMTDTYGYLYSLGSTTARYDSKIELIKKPYKYFTSSLVLETTYNYLLSLFNNENNMIPQYIFNEKRWKFELDAGKQVCLNKPESEKELNNAITSVTESFRKMKQYCDANEIEVRMCTPAISAELYDIYMEYAPNVYKKVMIDLVDVFGVVYDYGYPNEFTKNRDNYKDPFHLKNDDIYINSIWGVCHDYYRIINKENIDSLILENIE